VTTLDVIARLTMAYYDLFFVERSVGV